MKWIRISRKKYSYHWPAWCCLMRINRPIGSLLLLWPTLWALWLAEQGIPHLDKLSIFIFGVFFMRSAGCVINDYLDRNIDRHVQRTRTRPLPNRAISEKNAKLLFSLLVFISFCLVLMLNTMTIGLSIVALALTWIYPLMKRYMDIPQLVLGVAFSWSIPMVFAAISESLPVHCWLLFIANVAWTVAYDTQYALIDKEDDLRIGIKSTAVLFGQFDQLIIGVLQFSMLLLLGMMGWWMKLGTVFYVFLVGSAILFIQQQKLLSKRNKNAYFEAFSNNNRVGILIFIGIILNYTS